MRYLAIVAASLAIASSATAGGLEKPDVAMVDGGMEKPAAGGAAGWILPVAALIGIGVAVSSDDTN